MNIFTELQKRGYQITNKRVLGNLQYTTEETRRKDLIQELALVMMWLYEKHGIWIRVDCNSKESWSPILVNVEDGNYKVHPSYVSQKFIEKNNRLFNSPTEATVAAIEFLIENKLI